MSNPTPQDARIRALMVELAESAPLAPTAEELGLSTRPVALDDTQTLPSYTEVSSMVVKEPKRRRFFGGLAAAATMLLGGSVAYNVANNSGTAQPEAAVEQLLDAMAEEDALGILEAIDPAERTLIAPQVGSMVAELERTEVLRGVDTGDVAGFDFDHEGVELTARQLTSDLWAVRMVAGSFSSSTNPDVLPLGATAQTGQEVGFATDLDAWIASWPELFAEEDFEILVTKGDEGWRVNVLHTFLEAGRKVEGWPTPDYSLAIDPTGADSPETAVQEWMAAQGAWDVPAIINLVDPVEMPAVHLFESQLAEVFAGAKDDFGITSVYTFDTPRIDEDGGRLTAVIEQFTIERIPPDATFGAESTFSFDGGCREIESEGLAGPGMAGSCSDDADRTIERVALATPIEIRVIERDGRWFVSPLGTVIDQAFDALEVREAQDVDVNAVFATLFEIPILPVWSPGFTEGFVVFDEAEFEMINAGLMECSGPPLTELPSQAEAAANADELRSCLDSMEIPVASPPGGAGDFATQEIAMAACSYLWSPVLGLPLTLEETEALLPVYSECMQANGSPDGQAFSLVADYCSQTVGEPLFLPVEDELAEEEVMDDSFMDEFNECFDQFISEGEAEIVELVDE